MHQWLAISVAVGIVIAALATLTSIVFLAILACAALPSHSLNSSPPPKSASNTPPPATPTTAKPRDGSQTSDDCVWDEWLAPYDEDNRANTPLLPANTRNYATMSTQGIDATHTPGHSAQASAPIACKKAPSWVASDEI